MPKTWTAKDVERIMLISQAIVSLNDPVVGGEGDDMETELGDLLEDPEMDVEDQFLRQARIKMVAQIVDEALSEREALIVKKRFGFFGKYYTLEELGEELCLTRERIRQVEARAIRKLRFYCKRKKITEDDI